MISVKYVVSVGEGLQREMVAMKIETGTEQDPPWLHMRPRPGPRPAITDLNTAPQAELLEKARLPARAVERLLKARKRRPVRDLEDLAIIAELKRPEVAKLSGRVIGAIRPEVVFLSAEIAGEHIFSEQPWSLNLRFLEPQRGRVVVASVEVRWRGAPFVVQQEISPEQSRRGWFEFRMHYEYALPPGPIEMIITLYDDQGGADTRRLEAWILPSNPLSMFVSPRNRSIYSGSVRPDWSPPNWVTALNITFINGDGVDVRMRLGVEWGFWDGPVGSGTRVESGTFNWPFQIIVPRFGTFSTWLTFTSPPGSGVYQRYESKEDMAVQLVFTKEDGTRVAGEVTCRIMAGWGINIIQVGDYSSSEQQTIQAGINDARDIYENHGLTFSSVQWWSISTSQAGGYVILDNRGEWVSLLDDWTVPNDSVDSFVVRGMWDSFIGWSPIPGPAGKDGACQDDGLSVTTSLGCMAHELGHYMGGHDHADDLGRGNVMHSICGGRSFTYDQYRGFLNHGFTRIVR